MEAVGLVNTAHYTLDFFHTNMNMGKQIFIYKTNTLALKILN